jgi:hypothetical protein
VNISQIVGPNEKNYIIHLVNISAFAFCQSICSPFCQKFLGAMDLLSGDLQWGKMMGKPSWWRKKDHHHHQHHHHHYIISAENKQSLTSSLICMEFVSWADCKILLCWFCPANLQGIFHHWFHNFEDLLFFPFLLLTCFSSKVRA